MSREELTMLQRQCFDLALEQLEYDKGAPLNEEELHDLEMDVRGCDAIALRQTISVLRD